MALLPCWSIDGFLSESRVEYKNGGILCLVVYFSCILRQKL